MLSGMFVTFYETVFTLSLGSKHIIKKKKPNPKRNNDTYILQEDLENGEEVATCPSCSLIVKVIYDKASSPE